VTAEAEARHFHAGLGRQHPLGKQLSAHLKAEYGNGTAAANSRIPREVQHQRSFANTRAGGKDQQLAMLEATEQLIEVHEAGADGGVSFIFLGWYLKEAVEQLTETLEVPGRFGRAETEQQRFCLPDHARAVRATGAGKLSDLARNLHQASVHSVASDDPGVGLNADGSEVLAGDLLKVGLAADRFEVTLAL